MIPIYLIAIILCVTGQNVVKRPYARKTGGRGNYLLCSSICFFAMLFFVALALINGFSFNAEVIPYSIAFGASYIVATLFTILAIITGSLALTSLFISYSLILAPIYGFVFLKEEMSNLFLPGIILLVLSVFLINFNKSEEKTKLTPKWIIYIVLGFFGNGMCSVFQKMEQVHFQGGYTNEFMIIALAIACIGTLLGSIILEKNDITSCLRPSLFYGFLSGVMNGVVNLFIMILAGIMLTTVMFPIISGGSMLAILLASYILYKEKFSIPQMIGFVLGVGSIVLLSI